MVTYLACPVKAWLHSPADGSPADAEPEDAEAGRCPHDRRADVLEILNEAGTETVG